MNHVKVSIYINESDKWQHRPLHIELLSMLDKNEIAGGTVLRAVAGFTFKSPVVSASLVDIGSKLPLVVQFIDTVEKIDFILGRVDNCPRLRASACPRHPGDARIRNEAKLKTLIH